jgi:hypothetical protein
MSNYLQKVRELIDSSEVAEQTIDEINEVDFPKSATVLESLVYGESKQLESVRREQEVSPEDSDDPAEVAHLILAKIKTYTDKLDKGFEFKYQFALCATYQHLGETTMDMDYLDIIKASDAKSIQQAVQDSTEWKKQLPRKVALFVNEERECLLVNVKPLYKVVAEKDSEVQTVSKGRIEFGNEVDINTRANNLVPF